MAGTKVETKIRGGDDSEIDPVEIINKDNRFFIRAYNEGGLNFTDVDLLDVIQWVLKNCPEIMQYK